MTTPHNQPEPTELEKAIERCEVSFSPGDIPTLLSAAKQLKDITEVAKKLAEAMNTLSMICTCSRPTIRHEDGSVTAPGPHTEQCVSTRARKALNPAKQHKLL